MRQLGYLIYHIECRISLFVPAAGLAAALFQSHQPNKSIHHQRDNLEFLFDFIISWQNIIFFNAHLH